METHLNGFVEQAASRGKPIAVLVLDIDFFKTTTRTATTPATKCCASSRCVSAKSIRNIDLACRYGGEEFVIVMPETDMAAATMVAERLPRRIVSEPSRPRFSSAPTRRSIAPSTTAAIAWSRTRRETKRAPHRRAPVARLPAAYLIFPSRYSTCFFATGSYFFFTSLSVWVREFFLVT
jgi:GGDEF domain-containing protein